MLWSITDRLLWNCRLWDNLNFLNPRSQLLLNLSFVLFSFVRAKLKYPFVQNQMIFKIMGWVTDSCTDCLRMVEVYSASFLQVQFLQTQKYQYEYCFLFVFFNWLNGKNKSIQSYMTKGRVAQPNRMNFRKHSKRPFTSAQRVGFFNIGSGRKEHRVAGRVRVG